MVHHTQASVCSKEIHKKITDQFWSYGTDSVYWSYNDTGTVRICRTLKTLSALSS